MLRYRDGDGGAFDVLHARYRGRLFRYLLRQCGQRRIADELYQDVWLNLIRARAGYVVQARFATWLFRIAHNRLVDHYRASPDDPLLSFDDDAGPSLDAVAAAPASDPALQADLRQQAALLLGWIDALPAAQREAFLLQQEGGLSIDEIAQATGVARETARSRLRYAIARLRASRAAAGLAPAGSPSCDTSIERRVPADRSTRPEAIGSGSDSRVLARSGADPYPPGTS